MVFYLDVENPSEGADVISPEDRAAIVADVVAALGRQPDGTAGLIGKEVLHLLGGYPGPLHDHYEDGVLVTDWRKSAGLSKA